MDAHEHEHGLWLEDEPQDGRSRSVARRRVWVAIACVACVGAISVPIAFALTSNGSPSSSGHRHDALAHLPRGIAERQVLSALSATTSSGSFDVAYAFDPPTPQTAPTTTTTTMPCGVLSPVVGGSGVSGASTSNVVPAPSVQICSGSAGPAPSVTVTGQGTIDTDPFAMVAVSNVSGLGQITLRDDGTDVWEIGGADYGLAPGSTDDGPGASLSGFAGLVESTLGARQGALAMGGLASPTGYLDLDQSMITGADQTGTATVDGVPVTVYQISIDPAQGANVPGINAEQAKAITAAAAVLQSQGYAGTTVQVSIDASGYIRQTRSVAHFADGSTSTSEATFSNFGCAGTVLMPGQTGPTSPPAGCVSPDTGLPPATAATTSTTATSTTTTSTTTTTTTLPPTSTTGPPGSSTTTTNPQSATSSTSPPLSTSSGGGTNTR